MKKEIITVAGVLGAGKSSTAKRLAKELGYQHFSSGDLFRQIAKERGLSIEEINKTAELEVSIDHDTDERLRALGKDERVIIDSRLAFHWIPASFKVFLNLDMQTAVERIFKQIESEGRESQGTNSLEDLMETTRTRRNMELNRYKNLYQVDLADLTPFDLVVDTAKHDLDGVVQIILERYRKFLAD